MAVYMTDDFTLIEVSQNTLVLQPPIGQRRLLREYQGILTGYITQVMYDSVMALKVVNPDRQVVDLLITHGKIKKNLAHILKATLLGITVTRQQEEAYREEAAWQEASGGEGFISAELMKPKNIPDPDTW